MEAMQLDNATRIMAAGQDEYHNLHIIDMPVDIEIKGEVQQINSMNSFWKPNENELKALNDGAMISLGILGVQHPPVMLTVHLEGENGQTRLIQ
jgi:hypothetical protein